MSLNASDSKPKTAWSTGGALAAAPAHICSLEEVMSEQLANEMQEKETFMYLKSTESQQEEAAAALLAASSAAACATASAASSGQLDDEKSTEHDDFLLAQLLQLEMDKEYDESLRRHETQRNKNSKISISYDKFKSVHPVIERDERELTRRNQPDLTSSSESEDELGKIQFKNGVHGKGENMISKHDLLLSARNNAFKLAKFPPEFETGDSHNENIRLPNNVYNTLKVHSLSETKRHASRLGDKQDKSTSEQSLDPKTRLVLFKMINADILDAIGGVISTGKEATVLYAPGGKSTQLLVPRECVCKVYKTSLNEFKTREKYIGDDYRFKDRFKHLNPHKIVRMWAEKEMHNLMKMRRHEIACPDVVMLKRHVLVMSFIGVEGVPAPKLKEAALDDRQLRSAYEQCVQLVKDLYTVCGLVHADLSQFNLLWHDERVWCIDVSQSVEAIHPMGLEFLLRDCSNLYKFFVSKKLDDVKTGEELFNEVTGMNFKGQGTLFLSQIHKYTKDKQVELSALTQNKGDDGALLTSGSVVVQDGTVQVATGAKSEYNFDYHFEKSVKGRKKKADKKQTREEHEDSDSDDDDDDDDDYNDDDYDDTIAE